MNRSAWFVGYTPQLSTAVFLTKENKDGIPVSLSGTGGREMVTGGSFPAAIWTGYMKGALRGVKVQNFPNPPRGALRALDCPAVAAPGEKVPRGCPTPEIQTEFGPDPGYGEANPEEDDTFDNEGASQSDNDQSVSASAARGNGNNERRSGNRQRNNS